MYGSSACDLEPHAISCVILVIGDVLFAGFIVLRKTGHVC